MIVYVTGHIKSYWREKVFEPPNPYRKTSSPISRKIQKRFLRKEVKKANFKNPPRPLIWLPENGPIGLIMGSSFRAIIDNGQKPWLNVLV